LLEKRTGTIFEISTPKFTESLSKISAICSAPPPGALALPNAIASSTSARYSGRRAAAEMREGFVVASWGFSAAILENSPVSATTSVPEAFSN
jgi:hypothetical protein